MAKTATLLPAGLDDEITDVYSTTFIDESIEQLTAADKAANAAIEQLSSNAEKGKSIKIYRQKGNGQESMQFVMSEPADKFSIDELIIIVKREYGGGDYRFMIYNEKGKLSANKLICIAEKLGQDLGGSGDGMSGVFTQYMNKQDTLMHHVLNNNNSGENNRESFLREMVMYKELFSGQNSQVVQASSKTSIEQMTELFTLMNMIKDQAEPAQEKESGFGDIMKESIPLLTAIVSGAKGNNMQENERKKRPAKRGNSNPHKSDKMLVQIANTLVDEINKKTDSDIVAGQLCDKVPDLYLPKFEQFLTDKNILIKLAQANTELTKHEAWLNDVLEWCKYIIGIDSKFSGEDLTDTETNDSVRVSENDSIKNDGQNNR